MRDEPDHNRNKIKGEKALGTRLRGGGGGEGTPCDGLNGEAAPEGATILALQVYKKTGTS